MSNTDEDFMNMAETLGLTDHARAFYVQLVVPKLSYKRVAMALVSTGVELEWNVGKIYTKVSPLAKPVEFEVPPAPDMSNTICGCTGANILSSFGLQCSNCGHPNGLHNFGKGCRVTYNPKRETYWRIEPDGDYSKYRRVMT